MVIFEGGCDVSAAVTIPNTTLFVGASDENNTLRVYDWKTAGAPVGSISLDEFLGIEKEADLEGAAWADDRIYWIGSHGRNKDGKKKPERQQLFATSVTVSGGFPTITPVGISSRRVLEDMIAAPALAALGLEAASKLGPKEKGGLSIEGLAPGPDGSLLIGFRNPVIAGSHALLLPLLNPRPVVTTKEKACRFGTPMLLDLDGLGIRAMEFFRGVYLIIAGAAGEGSDFRLYQWTGKAVDRPLEVSTAVPAGLRPEELIVVRDTGGDTVILFSDDGEVAGAGGVKCKDSAPDRQSFRAHRMPLPSPVS